MDLTGEREAAQETGLDAEDGEQSVTLNAEQAGRVNAAQEAIAGGLKRLDEISRPGREYGIPPDTERNALLNALAHILVDKGITTIEDLFVSKIEQTAVIVQACAKGAVAHAAQSELVVAHRVPPSPPQGKFQRP